MSMFWKKEIDDEDFAERFCRIARSCPSATCLINDRYLKGPSELTYANVYDAASRLQRALRGVLSESKQLVAIQMERGADLLISVLACLLNRSPFLLMEPSTPLIRRNFLLNNAKAALLITDTVPSTVETNLPESVTVHSFAHLSNQVYESDDFSLVESHSCDDTMYVIYTSGSTGQPKGVVVPYRAMYNRFHWMWTTYKWIDGDVQLWKTSVTFVDCIWEMLGGLLSGVPTVIASSITIRDPCLLLDLIYRTCVTRATFIPTMLSALIKLLPTISNDCLHSLRHVIVSGEPMPKIVCKQFLALPTKALLLNLYGSTEIGNDATYYEVRDVNDEYDTIPIGKPITNMYYKIVDEELWITGDGLASGYLNNEAMTAAKFVRCVDDGRLYFKTGDRVHECVRTGQLHFLCRLDDAQMKIRGALINLAEVEAVCMQHSSVDECGCFVHETKAQLIAFIYSSSTDLTISDLQTWLSSQLSDFEVPSLFVFATNPLPRTTTGKIDRKQLALLYEVQKQDALIVSTNGLISDRSGQRIMDLWCATLGIRKDNEASSRLTFTELGGHSLLAIHLQCALIYEFGILIPIEQFFCRTMVIDLIQLIRNSTSIKPSLQIIENNYQTVPLTLAQRSIWVADELHHLSAIPAYNVSCAFEILSVDITADQLKKSIHTLLQRHESLAMIFSRNTSGEIFQKVTQLDDNLTVAGTCLFQEVPIENVEETNQILNRLATFKFNLNIPQPLCRFFLCTSPSQRILTIVLHHVIVDGWSIGILKRDLNGILTSEALPSIGMQFAQYAQLEYRSDPHRLDDDLIFWKNKLDNGALNPTRLPHDHETLHTDRVGHVQIVFPSDLTDLIRAVTKSKDVTPFMVLLTTFSSLLARYTNETDIIVGLPVANRVLSEVEQTVGLFMNTVVVRTDLTGTPSFIDLLSRVKMTVLDAFAHQSLPFVHLMSELEHVRRDQHQDSLFHILFAYQNIADEPTSVLRNIKMHEQVAKFELDVNVWTEPNTMLIDAYFRLDLFDISTIERLLFHWLHLTRSALTNSMDPYLHWSMVPDDEFLSVASGAESRQSNAHVESKNLCQLFFEQIERTPHIVAIEDNSVRLTYMQVWQRSIHFAHTIRQVLKTSSNHCIAIRMQRGIDLIQTIWSVLLSGNYFVYIDSRLPVERQQFILRDTEASLLIIDGPECTERIPTIRFETVNMQSSTITLQSNNDPADLAYILYTSGSSGLPKGVRISHQAIIARMINVNYHSIRPQTRIGQLSTFSFDMSTFELFGTLLNGGTLVIVAQELTCSAQALLELHLDIIAPSTAVLNILVQQERSRALFTSLRNIYFGGEKANMKYLHRALEHQVLGKFIHLYGPTETTVFALFYKIDTAIAADAITIPIGRPLSNTFVYIVDQSFQLTPRGISGQLLIGGAGLSLGYHNDSDLTRKKFISNPFGDDLVYCTGDICRMRDDGTIEFLYRLDNQVKLRSQRLELTEIEFHLLQHELIADAIVLLRDDVVEDEKHLVGYIQPISSNSVLNSDQVRTFLAKYLPDYMVPSFIVIMSQLPLNHVGKIDKKSLPKPSRSKSSMNTFDIVRQIFLQVLKQEEIDMHSSFFHLGGHSLSAMEIIGKLYERFSVQITIPTLFQAPSIVEFVRHIETRINNDEKKQLTKVMETNKHLSHVCRAPLTPTQQQFWIFWKLKPDNCYYNVPLAFEINGRLNIVALTRCFHHLMCKYTLLRIKFEEGGDGTIWQEENKHWSLPLVEEFVEGDLTARLQYHSMKPFHLSEGQVCRFVVLHMTENRHVLLINFHHIVCDGYSVSQLMNELLDLYALGNSNLPTTSFNMMSFLDYATRISKSSRMNHHLDSMVNYLRDFRSLTFDTNVGVEQGRDIGLVSHISSFIVSREIAEKLRNLAKEHACTLYTVLLTLFECFLSVYSYNTSDIVLGSIMSTRSEFDFNDVFGPLINTVPIHTHLPDDTTTTFIDVLHSVRTSVLFAMEHQMVPFADIVQRLRSINTDHSLFTYLPVFRVLFEMNSYNLYDRNKTFSDATEWKSLNAASLLLPYTKSDIDLEIMNYGDGQPMQVTFNGNRALFELNMVDAMANCYRCAIETVVRQPTCSRTYLWQRMDLARKNTPHLILHERFREQVTIAPDQRAVIYENQIWTYDKLLRKAEEIASYLCEINTKPGHVVGLYMKRCVYLVAAMFGVLIAGATYLYLDPELPDERIRIMLEDAAVQLVIGDEKEILSRKSIFKNISLLSNILSKNVRKRPLFPTVKPSDYCYLIYTSGSTGKPKGVKIQHQAVVQRLDLPVAVTPSSNVAQLTSCSFDVYILEVYGALLNGATLVIYDKTLIFQPKLLSEQITLQRITHMYLPTPIFNLLAEYVPDVFANMECVLMAGDRANSKLMRAVLQRSEPPKRLINAYGPTETTCIATWYDASAQSSFSLVNDGPVPIGQALPNTLLYIANPTTLELVVNGEEGELLIGGYGVSDGYMNDKDETEAKFLINRYVDSDKIYRTGDLVRQCQDGNLQFLGRIDTQVKVNGYRIDPIEIEHALQGYPTITEAIVIVKANIVPDTQSIVAYVCPAKQVETDIRRYLSDRLPTYMLPSFIVPIDEIPINSTGGKRDVNNLPPVRRNGVVKNDYVLVEEGKMQTAWNNVLNPNMCPRVFHTDDDFFACGGTSITLVKLHAQLESLFGLSLDVGRLFEFRTVSTQIVWLASLQPAVKLPIRCPQADVSLKGIAVIGMSARYGPIETITDLWTALHNGTDCCTRISNEELIKRNPSVAQMIAMNPNYVHAGCTMNNAYCFDHIFFGMTKRDADITDPQHRIMLEATYEALESAGLVPQTYKGTIGMFGALFRNSYADCFNLLRANPYDVYDDTKARMGITTFDPATVMRVEIGNMIDGAPTFVSYKLGLNGPSMAIQTACSSSGTALHMALRSLEAGDCTVAIVAGVCITFPLDTGYNYQPGMIMSKTGTCCSFDECADGVVGGDGVGVVVLMKTTEAASDGYPIRSIITGSAINNDGQNKPTYSTTSPVMQANCMRRALLAAGIQHPMQEIDYIEAHGSGVQLGDFLEMQALMNAYANDDNGGTTRAVHLGSIKTNVGHTAHAATIAGLIKIVVSLEAGELPATLNFHRFNSMISHMQPPFTVNTRTISWPLETNSKRPRRAALNALGQGGTNTHFIVEEGVPMSETYRPSEHHLFLFSAKTEYALSKVKQRLLDYLSNANDHQLPNIAFTLACGRIPYEKRDFVVAASIEELKQQLLNSTLPNNNDESSKRRIVFVFPGQGSQYQGMARYVYDRFPHTCAPVIDTCLRELHDQDASIHRTVTSCLFDQTYDDHTILAQYAQLTLFIVEYTLATLFLSLNIHPDYLVGHSSGEFVAACIAKVMTVEDAIRLLVQRCQLMVTASPGAMLAIEVNSKDDLQAVSATYNVELAVINSTTQHVYSGTTANIRKLEIDLRNKGYKVKLLSTLTGFHSRLMDPICQKLKETVKRIPLREPTIPIVSTVTGRLIDVGQMTSIKYWCDHLRQPVLFGPCLSRMLTDHLIINDKSTIFIPVGPGKILHSLLSHAVPKATVIKSPLVCDQSTALLYTLGSIWTKNLVIHWSEYFHGTRSRRIPLPTYPFARTICVTNDRATITTTNDLVDGSSRQNSCTINTPTDLFEILDRRHAVHEVIERKSVGKKAPPWKITKRTDVTVKWLDHQHGTFTSVEVSPTLTDETQLNLGSSSFLFVQALYYEALETGRIHCDDSLMKFLPVEHLRANLSLTIGDLLQSKINTTTRCSTPDDLLAALSHVTIQINHIPNVFAISLLAHILAALYEISYDELLHDHIVIPFGLKQTCLDVSTSSEAYYPATGVRSSIADLQTIRISTIDLPISRAIRKALTNGDPQFIGAEQLIMTVHPNDSNKSLILASEQPLQEAFYQSIIKQVGESSINYEDIVRSCLIQLLGFSDPTMMSNFSSHTSFEQIGIDSLRAITFAENLSQKLGIELPINVIFQYPNVKSLASRLKQIGSSNHSSNDVLREYTLHEQAGMPRVYEATNNQCSLSILLSFVTSHKVELLEKLHECGALLFRGFEIETAEEFSKVAELLVDKDKTFLDYRDGISPRTRLTDKVFTSTDYPKQFDMALHNEMSYSYTMPSMIFFFCQVAPHENGGGETPIGDSTAIYNAIDPNIRREFIEKKLLYVTNLPSKTNSISLGKSWQDTYQTDSKAEVEAFLKDKQIQFKWLPNDRLRTLRQGDAIRQHPITGETVWSNHAHLFHPTDLDESTRQALQKRFQPLDMPKNCFFGNGDPIPDASLNHIRQVLKQKEIKWSWRKGDILVLDNLRTAHGRASFDGQRRILVVMC